MGGGVNPKFVGGIYRGHMFYEGKVILDDHFLVVEEYMRPSEHNPSWKIVYCLVMSIRTGAVHEVAASRLLYGPSYKRVA